MSFLDDIQARVLVLDGAMGTMLQERGLRPGAPPEGMNLSHPEVVASVHRAYRDAGADLIVTNSFGGSRPKLEHYGLGDRVTEINAASVAIARSTVGPGGYVAGSMGPTGLFVEPVGNVAFDVMKGYFTEQAKALMDAGVDLLTLETFLDVKEIRAALIAIRELSGSIPVIAMMTFDDGGRTVLGTSPEAFAVTADAAGATVIGSNCGLGPDGITDILTRMRRVTRRPLISQANAGLPRLVEGKTCFPAAPAEMTLFHRQLLDLNVRIIGGCCGTTPDHIRAIRDAMEPFDQSWRDVGPDPSVTFLSSRSGVVAIGGGNRLAIIGERINPTGKKGFAAELLKGEVGYIRREAREQVERGADLLDVNVGAPGVDEPAMMERGVFCVTSTVSVPLVIDSSNPDALEAGLKAADGKVLVNSVNGEEKSLARVLPLVRKFGAAVIGLTLDEGGIPKRGEDRVEIGRRIVERGVSLGIPRCDILLDTLTLTVSAEPDAPRETLHAVRLAKERLGVNTVLGVSNVSFGLPRRPVVSSAFFTMAAAAGLDAAIINPKEEQMMDAFRSSMLLLGKDPQASAYIAAYGNRPAESPPSATVELPADIRSRLAEAVIRGDREGVTALVEEALSEGLTPLQISNEGLLAGLEEVGRRFADGRYFLPQVIQSADTMQTAFARLKKEMTAQGVQPLGTILMATVEGDIHDIGKNIVCTLLENHGFRVIDLGKNVSCETILQKAREHRVDAVGLSALMTTTMTEMERVIATLRREGVKSFTMVGGAVVTEEYARSIGSDLYAKDAMEAVAKVKELLGRG